MPMSSARSGVFRSYAQLFFVFILLALFLSARSSRAATIVVTDADKGNDVQMKVGDTLEVRLAANPTTGYMWFIHPKSTAMLKLIGQKEIGATEPGVGRPIVQIFNFQPRRSGDGILLLHYVRSWEKPALGEEQFTLHVIVE